MNYLSQLNTGLLLLTSQLFSGRVNPKRTNGTTTIENTLSTAHETFDHYNILAYRFIQDALSYETVNHPTHPDLREYTLQNDRKKNTVLPARTVYSL